MLCHTVPCHCLRYKALDLSATSHPPIHFYTSIATREFLLQPLHQKSTITTHRSPRQTLQTQKMHIRLLYHVLPTALLVTSALADPYDPCNDSELSESRCDGQIWEQCEAYLAGSQWTPKFNCYADSGHHCRCTYYHDKKVLRVGCFKYGTVSKGTCGSKYS
ncbi:hypothetical protein EJ03DRAFT_327278 [Teratosphaeria nubilosa]|uniref:Uncharacterized protein n=1 Tax=Teratosphaeria nubilosa TaxID=161662 RepID=A0A6G1L9R2_9PEZI|nr:hypothetical protein EJ03DRAFT_327278 [Teratosphaeria nubilosa]